LPLGYMIPMDGPVSDMIRAQKRHGYRPSHIHFLVGARIPRAGDRAVHAGR
jgi:hydroxyquinol 1,2-dioxygenase